MDNQMKGMRVEETQRMLEDVKTARSAEAGEAGSALEEMRSRVRNLVDERANLSVKLSATEEQRLRAEQAAEAERDRVRLTSEAALLERQRADEAAQARLKAEEHARPATMRASSGLASAVQDLGAAQARAEMLQTELQNKNKSVDSLSGQLQQHQTLLSLTTKQLDDHKERHNVLLANNLELERAHQSVQQRSSNLNSQLMAAQSDLALTNRALSGTRY
jgi:chromosome segregation ATPase